MEHSFGPRDKTMTSSSDTKIDTSSVATGKSTENVQHVHLPHLVVGKILEDLDFEDLLQCSLINKVWNYEGRRLLREKHECALAFNLDSKSPKEIMKFLETTLATGLPVPYVSLSIKKKNADQVFRNRWKLKESKLAEIAQDFVLRAGPFKVVQLDFQCLCDSSFEVYFTRKVLTEVHMTAEVLKIKNLGRSPSLFTRNQYPELKKLEVDDRAEINPSNEWNLQKIIRDSPKLETVECRSFRLLYLVNKLPRARKLELVKEVTCSNIHKYPFGASSFAQLKPKLEKLYIPRQSYGYDHYDRHQLGADSSIFMSLLLSSQVSLFELQATYEMLQEVHRKHPLASFKNLHYLIVDAPWGMVREDLDLDPDDTINVLFPNLKKLKVNLELEPPDYDSDDFY